MKKVVTAYLCLLFVGYASVAQNLQPGFDKTEYLELLKVSAYIIPDTTYTQNLPAPERFSKVYRSPVTGLENLWELWSDGKSSVISIRGTTQDPRSWLANFYAAMVPAAGTLTLGDSSVFTYRLSDHPHAAVHAGWLLCTAYLYADIRPRLDALYQDGQRDVYIMGHSQGGAIAYLLTAHLLSLQQQGRLPADLRMKTYCSAAPKPGNLYFAYSYEAMTREGWAFNVVNAHDWVPETPISIQTFDDFNTTNPFRNARSMIRAQKFPRDIILGYVYGQLNTPTLKARKRYQKYLGKTLSKQVIKQVEGFQPSGYYNSNHYVRTGHTIVLQGDAEYFLQYPDSDTEIFRHHFHGPYLYLAEKL